MGRFKNVGLVWRRRWIVMSRRPCEGALNGSQEISSTQPWPRKCSEMEIPVGGVIMPHAAHSWSLLWAAPQAEVLKYLRSAHGVPAGLPVPQIKVPFCGTPGVGGTPCCTSRKARVQLLFELCCGMFCLLAACKSTLWWGSAPFVCGQKEAVVLQEEDDLSQSDLFKTTHT